MAEMEAGRRLRPKQPPNNLKLRGMCRFKRGAMFNSMFNSGFGIPSILDLARISVSVLMFNSEIGIELLAFG